MPLFTTVYYSNRKKSEENFTTKKLQRFNQFNVEYNVTCFCHSRSHGGQAIFIREALYFFSHNNKQTQINIELFSFKQITADLTDVGASEGA